MEAFSLSSSISIAVQGSNFNRGRLATRSSRSCMVCCQTGGSHAIKSTGISSVLAEPSSALISPDHASSLLETRSLVLTPTGKDEGIGIIKFLRGKTFLITGATGFLGKDEDAAEYMKREVDVIINSAANTTFDERYDTALDINTGGPTRLISFAKQCLKLNLFLQVSTAYVNGQRQGRIIEKPFCIGETITGGTVYGSKLNVEDEIKLVMEAKRTLGDDSLPQKMKELGIERARKFGWQDTYVFTKAMGEMMIDSLRGDVPVVVIRPSVIESTHKEPFPGWMEGNRMMDPIILQYGKGQLTGFLVDPNGVLDVVPADMVVNATLAAMAKHGGAAKPECSVYHVASSVVNPLVFRDLAKLLHEHFSSSPVMDPTGTQVRVSKMKLFSSMEDFCDHLSIQAELALATHHQFGRRHCNNGWLHLPAKDITYLTF